MTARAWSAPATTQRVLDLLSNIDWRTAQVADIGAGSGHLSRVLGDHLHTLGLNPAEHLSACDLIPESFAYAEITCRPIAPDGRLPFADASFDAVVSIEVIEHVENQFAFWRELARITKPGGTVIVTTPNVLNVNSRLRTLYTGFPLLFEPLPLEEHDPRRLSGHIHPVTPYFLVYGALRAGFVDPSLHPDRIKASAVSLALLFWPLLRLGRLRHQMRWRRKYPDVVEQNQALLAMQDSWTTLTCRSTVLRVRKPVPDAPNQRRDTVYQSSSPSRERS